LHNVGYGRPATRPFSVEIVSTVCFAALAMTVSLYDSLSTVLLIDETGFGFGYGYGKDEAQSIAVF